MYTSLHIVHCTLPCIYTLQHTLHIHHTTHCHNMLHFCRYTASTNYNPFSLILSSNFILIFIPTFTLYHFQEDKLEFKLVTVLFNSSKANLLKLKHQSFGSLACYVFRRRTNIYDNTLLVHVGACIEAPNMFRL